MNRKLICLGIFFFMTVSCKHLGNVPANVDYVLQQAGNNRSELEKVLAYYRNDSLKYQAACFLIENIPKHFSFQGKVLDYCKQKLSALPLLCRADSMNSVWKQATAMYPDEIIMKVPDYTVIKSTYLIANIDQAFRAWEKAPWHKEVDFEAFCRYILPYRISNEQLADDVHWRDSLAQRYASYIRGVVDLKQAFALLTKEFDNTRKRPLSKCPYMLDALTTEEAGFSLCEQRCVVRGGVMRALGLPIVCDYVNNWANYSRNGHLWISLMGNDGETFTLHEGDSIPRTDNPIDASFFKTLASPELHYPYWVDSLKRTAKVYRKNYFERNDKGKHAMDVSEVYGLTDSLVIQTDIVEKNIYLCTFRTGDDWRTIVQSEVFNGRCVFRNLGTPIVYLPAILKEGKVVALDAPFILFKGGEVRKLIPTSNKQTVRLNRKYILMSNWTNNWYEMLNGCFEASNDSSFLYADVLCRISKLPIYRNEIKLRKPKSYRYVRYVSPSISKSTLAELTFFNGNEELQGKVMGKGLDYSAQERVFDHDFMTIGYPSSVDFWVGLDLGKKCRIDKLVYYPRNDDNFIVPSEQYELFYYDKAAWHTLGAMKAKCEELVYKNVPQNVLFLLKNRTKGKEERVFTYENGKQVWW